MPVASTLRAAVPPGEIIDRRTLRGQRTRRALRDALAGEIRACGGLDRVSVAAIAQRADVTRRTFYSHFRDIPDLLERSEAELLEGLASHLRPITQTRLDQLSANVAALEPCPGSVELLAYVRDNGDFMSALLGPGGDPAFADKIRTIATECVASRALEGIDASAAVLFFDYYLSFAVSAELGVLRRWLEGGMRESIQVMARVMTLLMFVRPGDLYGKHIDIDLASYGLLLMSMEDDKESHDDNR